MADKKKMSVAEILAAARAEKSGGAAPASAAASTGAAPAAAEPTQSAAPAAEAASSVAPAAAAPAAKIKPGSMSVAEILAAARAKPGAAAAKPVAPAAAAPAAEKPAAKPQPAAAEKPAAEAAPKAAPKTSAALDTASILAAARSGGKPGPVSKSEAEKKGIPVEAPAKKKLAVPPPPTRPAYLEKKKAAEPSRRGFFAYASDVLVGGSLALGFASLAVTHILWVLGLARYLFPNVLTEPPTRFKVGFPDALALGQVDERFKAGFGVWIVKGEYEGEAQIFALKSVCTHLGCTPNWLEAEQKFKCPCHGSGFYKDGVNFEGPAPRPLERYAIKVADDGQLEVDKSRVFHEETGEWSNSASFVTA
ncbi:MAG: Rieske 2Fe-2S domain-containing protein [Planctomycetota bacterium]